MYVYTVHQPHPRLSLPRHRPARRPPRLRRRRPHQPPPARAPAQHRLPPPRRGRRAHGRALLPLAHDLALRAARPGRRLPPEGRLRLAPLAGRLARHHRRRLPHPRGAPGALPPRPPYLQPHERVPAVQHQLARWLQLLAAKGVQDLVIVNRPWPCDVLLPDTLFAINTLVRLYIGFWKLPDTARLGSYRTFPHLRELGICSVVMEEGDVDAMVARSPVLESLSIQGSSKGLRLRLISQILRCVQICGSIVEDIALVKAPCLERLILHGCRDLAGGMCTRIRILDAPNLRVVGFLEPANHVLKIGDAIIRAGMKESTATILTSVKILSLNVRFGIRSEAEMVPRFLQCFPNVKTLHIMSGKCNQSTGTLNLKFKEVPIEIAMSGISEMYFHEFRGDEGEVAFLKSLFKSADVLEMAVIMMANPSFTPFSPDDALSKVKSASELSRSSSKVVVVVSGGPEGGRPWSFQKGTDFSCEDPFSVLVDKLGKA